MKEENIERSERIKKYILGEMAADESAAFEKELAQDSKLRVEYEMMKDISHSVNKLGHEEKLRAMLAEKEKGYVKTREVSDDELKQVEEELEQNLHTVSVYDPETGKFHIQDEPFDTSPVIPISTAAFAGADTDVPVASLVGIDADDENNKPSYSAKPSSTKWIIPFLAAAAAIALAVILPHNARLAKSGYQESLRILQSDGFISSQSFRGEDEIYSLLEMIAEDVNNGQYADALTRIKITEKEIDETIASLKGDDSAITRMAELEVAKQELLWYKAILLMNNKETGKAKKTLRRLARSDSSHSEEARRILKEIL